MNPLSSSRADGEGRTHAVTALNRISLPLEYASIFLDRERGLEPLRWASETHVLPVELLPNTKVRTKGVDPSTSELATQRSAVELHPL